jgi:hypothetical protein
VNVTLDEAGEICGTECRKPDGTAAKSLPKELMHDRQIIALSRGRQPSLLLQVSFEVLFRARYRVDLDRRCDLRYDFPVAQHTKYLA